MKAWSRGTGAIPVPRLSYRQPIKVDPMCICKYCYETFVPRSGKFMLSCRLFAQDGKGNSTPFSPLQHLCLCQRYCRDQGKYIPHQQKSGCKHFQPETK